MRVISGKYRRLNLIAPIGKDTTRPTLDQIKESMFNIISFHVDNRIVCDLFAGSGALGIEALSRGASFCYFNDRSKPALKAIQTNLKTIKAPNDTFKVLSLDYLNCLEYFKNRNIKIDLFFLDPPYKDQIYEQIINKMEEDGTLSEDALIVIEASLESPLPAFDNYLRKDYKYTDKTLVILEKYQ